MLNEERYHLANPRSRIIYLMFFEVYDYQFIDATETEETEASSYFYQNLGEAEYLIAEYELIRISLIFYLNQSLRHITAKKLY